MVKYWVSDVGLIRLSSAAGARISSQQLPRTEDVYSKHKLAVIAEQALNFLSALE